MLRFPNCKINLGLYITNKRADGYHDLETVFYPVSLKDALEIVPAKETKLHMSGKAVTGNTQNNLILKAYNLLKDQYGESIPHLDIHLHKAIPIGAGMGGGSSDGAFMLQMLNDYCELSLSKETLTALALQLGSDCPFFIYNTPQLAKGRGELMEPIAIDLSNYSIQLVCPELHISTAGAFSMIQPKPAPFDLRKLAELPVIEWKDKVANDFETPVFEQHPVLKNIKAQLYNQGALYAAMSGSGSTIFGILPKGQKPVIQADLAFESHFLE